MFKKRPIVISLENEAARGRAGVAKEWDDWVVSLSRGKRGRRQNIGMKRKGGEETQQFLWNHVSYESKLFRLGEWEPRMENGRTYLLGDDLELEGGDGREAKKEGEWVDVDVVTPGGMYSPRHPKTGPVFAQMGGGVGVEAIDWGRKSRGDTAIRGASQSSQRKRTSVFKNHVGFLSGGLRVDHEETPPVQENFKTLQGSQNAVGRGVSIRFWELERKNPRNNSRKRRL